MKLQVEQTALAEGARWVARHIPPSAADPAALAVLLTADGETLTVAYSSAEVAASVAIDAHVIAAGRAAVSGKVFADILGALPPLQVELTGDDNGVDMIAGSNTFRLGLLDTNSYPSLPPMPAISGQAPGDLFATAVANVAPAVDYQTAAMPELGGIRIRPDGDRLQLMATDRYRVAVQTIPWQPNGDAVPALLPGRALTDVAKAAGGADSVDLALTAGTAGVHVDGRTSISRLLPVDKFPNADAAFPKEYTGVVTCDVDELAETVRRIGLLLEGEQAIELAISGDHMTIQAMRNTKATGKARIACRLEGPDTFDIAFNPRYLLDGLGPIDDEVAINLTTYSKPALIHAAVNNPSYQYLVVPVRDPAKAAS
ncbi:DNA polymerase III subunit beta [Streptomyces bugieae]|uniref:DNA polymerase III subunit beta n=1 Tax=Streptomyces bugieae TaxID=3098223 RepID=A0ABU7NL62_9ACTN|nr:DNA polymerase III subunit beta [Streptomyces sp. DSM 41528]